MGGGSLDSEFIAILWSKGEAEQWENDLQIFLPSVFQELDVESFILAARLGFSDQFLCPRGKETSVHHGTAGQGVKK